MSRRNSQAGTSLVETCIILTFLLPVVATGMMVATAAGFRTVAHHLLYETLICVSEGQSSASCQQRLLKQLQQVIPWGRCEQLKITSSPTSWSARLVWRISELIRIKVQHQLPRRLVRSP